MTEERRYEVLAVLGQGGFGTVYHARFLGEGGFSKEVALKVLNPDMENVAEVASRLRDEARVLGLLRHRAIVAVDRLTQIDGRWTVVMEYVDGHDLSQLLRQGPLPVGPALEIAAEVAGALHAAYTRSGPNGLPLRLLHRDLKPSNVRITPFGEVKILDFGIARAEFQEREAKTRSLSFGTLAYMSPERLDHSDDGAPGDIYALGVVLFELITGMQLGRSSANTAKHAHKLHQASEALCDVAVPSPVAELVIRMLAFEATARPTAAEVERRAADLARKLSETSLRSWADEVMSSMAARQAAIETEVEITGSILVEHPTTPDEDGGTVWEPLLTPTNASAQHRKPPVHLAPAVTGASDLELTQQPVVDVERWPVIVVPPATSNASALRAGRRLLTAIAAIASLGCLAGGLWWLLGHSNMNAVPAAGPTQLNPTVEAPAIVAPSAGHGGDTVAPEQQASQTHAGQPSPAVSAAPSTRQATKYVPFTQNSDEVTPLALGVEMTSAQSPIVAVTASAMVAVRLEGDADSASLSAPDRTYALPSRVPPGTYTIMASFEGGPMLNVGTATLEVGPAVVVRCALQFGKCSPVKERW